MSDMPAVFLAGDSTCHAYAPERAPLTGWGQALAFFAEEGARIENCAQCGRSSKSFIAEGRLQAILERIAAGDYLLVQFGHNDQKKEDAARFTVLPDEYQNFLSRYIGEARAKGAKPLLITPPVRLKRDANGALVNDLASRSQAVRDLAAKTQTPLIDLNAYSFKALNEMDFAEAELLYMASVDGEDFTHFTPAGAVFMGQYIGRQLYKMEPEPFSRYFNAGRLWPSGQEPS